MLEEKEDRGHVVAQRLPETEDVLIVEHVAVGHLRGPEHRASFEALGPSGGETGETADIGTEGGGLFPVEIARGADHHVPEAILADEQEVEYADDASPLQPVELRQDLTLESVPRKRHRHQLDRPGSLRRGLVRSHAPLRRQRPDLVDHLIGRRRVDRPHGDAVDTEIVGQEVRMTPDDRVAAEIDARKRRILDREFIAQVRATNP